MALTTSLLGVSVNCESVSVTVNGAADNYTVRIYLLGDTETLIYEEENIDQNTVTVSTINTQDLIDTQLNGLYSTNATLDAIIESVTSFNGIFKFTINDGSETATIYSIGTCSVDCCLANLIQDNLECACTTENCCEDIKKAEKIFILIKGAIVDAANGDIASAQLKYTKATELCDTTSCNCNC